jgi:hypothetical protein
MSDICPSRDDAQPHIFTDGPYCTMCNAPHPEWTKAKIGFYWSNGPWNLATAQSGNSLGYILAKEGRGLVGELLTWTEVQQLIKGEM